MPAHEHRFAAPVLRLDDGLRMHYVPLPSEVADDLRAARVRRLVGTVNGRPFRLAVQGRAGGERFLAVSRQLLRDLGAAFGDTVAVALRPDPEPDHVELGEELAAALDHDAEAAARFFAMTRGRQRSLASYVTSARRAETRVARALELAHKLRTHTLYGDLRPEP